MEFSEVEIWFSQSENLSMDFASKEEKEKEDLANLVSSRKPRDVLNVRIHRGKFNKRCE